MQKVIDKAVSMYPEIKRDKVLKKVHIREASRAIGAPEDYSIFNQLTKVSHGNYAFDYKTFKGVEVLEKQERKPRQPRLKPTVVETTKTAEVQAVQNYALPNLMQKVSQAKFGEVPARDTNYVTFGHFRDVENIIKSRKFFPIFITGMSGNGKSSMVMESCAKHNIPMIRMNITAMTTSEDLIGHKTLVDGNVVIVEGPVLIAMRNGIPVLLDELDAAQSNSIMCLQGILEGRPFYFALTNEYIVPAKGFNIIATGNTKGKGSSDGRYVGTNVLNDAFLERFAVTFEQEFPSEAVETKMIINWMKDSGIENNRFAEDLAKWSSTIRKTFTDGGIDDLISSRRLKHIVEAYSIFKDEKKAIRLATGRFDESTSDAFRTVFDKISTESLNPTPAPVEATVVPEVANA